MSRGLEEATDQLAKSLKSAETTMAQSATELRELVRRINEDILEEPGVSRHTTKLAEAVVRLASIVAKTLEDLK